MNGTEEQAAKDVTVTLTSVEDGATCTFCLSDEDVRYLMIGTRHGQGTRFAVCRKCRQKIAATLHQ